MDTRREFIKKAALLSGAAGVFTLPGSIQKALAINPAPGSTYLDAEHVVFLMQENRSFDHCYGALQGVRGFNDPRAIRLPNRNPVWLQTNQAGETFAPFRLNMKETKTTWMGSLPHSWGNQVDARNNGKYDKWLDVKKSGHDEYAEMPLTMGYYTRDDIPFYYALADSFTVCDQHFCSSLTGTTPNRLYFWTGTIREEQHENSKANVWNEDVDYDSMAQWKTYPERLEENGISWKIYQNEISVDGGFTGEEDAWMSNFGDNPIEYFKQYNVKLSSRYINYLQQAAKNLPVEIDTLEKQFRSAAATGNDLERLQKKLDNKKKTLTFVLSEQKIWTKEKYDQLSPQEKSIHEKAFSSNAKDKEFYQLTNLKYHDGNEEREINIPKGDVLFQFREDVKNNSLPTVSWLVAPENFSDHPSSAWFGAWYVSEVLDILTQNPEVWKKTIFILTYDENDGYFDHYPPFVAPNPSDPSTGKTSSKIDTRSEFVTMEQEKKKTGWPVEDMRESSIGLGYRVPLVIASPWSRGGRVCSEIFDHTSSLQFLEKFLAHKTGKNIQETNMSNWRRAICGDLTSSFKPYNGEKIKSPTFVKKDPFIENIHKAKFKEVPSNYKRLSNEEIEQVSKNPHASSLLPKQEKGTRASCALPYELYVNGGLKDDRKSIAIDFAAGNKFFGDRSIGSPFTVYALNKYKNEPMKVWSYGVAAGEEISDEWSIADFDNQTYHLAVHGPNGFLREFIGGANDPDVNMKVIYEEKNSPTGNIIIELTNKSPSEKYSVEIVDNSYKSGKKSKILEPSSQPTSLVLDLKKTSGWYDFSIKIQGNNNFEKRYAGRVETGKESISDPAMA